MKAIKKIFYFKKTVLIMGQLMCGGKQEYCHTSPVVKYFSSR